MVSAKWENESFVPCVDEVEIVTNYNDFFCDVKTKDNVVFEFVEKNRLFPTMEDAAAAINHLL